MTSIVANGRAVFQVRLRFRTNGKLTNESFFKTRNTLFSQVMFAYYTSSYLFYDLYPGLINWMSFLGTAGTTIHIFHIFNILFSKVSLLNREGGA